MNETTELILTIVVFGLMFGIIIWLMIYWSKNNTVVDERDKKYYQKKEKEKSDEINHT
ncbi:MAG: hypothetical protein Q9M89_09775 [Persephonella sp.]|nr:hypothetical protein [Persephonella sp.]